MAKDLMTVMIFSCSLHDRSPFGCRSCCTAAAARTESESNSFTHSLIHSFIHTLIHSFTHSLIHSFIHSLIHSFIHSFGHSFIHSLIEAYQAIKALHIAPCTCVCTCARPCTCVDACHRSLNFLYSWNRSFLYLAATSMAASLVGLCLVAKLRGQPA